jgi:exo-1,4-beta-D-glucosaminidase
MGPVDRAISAPRRIAATCIAIALGAGALVTAVGASATPVSPRAAARHASLTTPQAPSARRPELASAPSQTGSTNIFNLGAKAGWKVQSSAIATQGGAQISSPGFTPAGWLSVRNDDAGAPGTEVEALLQNGRCPDDHALQPVNQSTAGRHSIFYSDNMRSCFGQLSSIGPDTIPAFRVPWWWRTNFRPPAHRGHAVTLIVNGVIGSASVWVNGRRVATSSTVTGAYTRFSFSITRLLVPGTNCVAIEVNANNPRKMFTLDNVDWTQIPPDNNTGIQFPVQLAVDGPLAVSNSHVDQSDNARLTRAGLTVWTDVINTTARAQSGDVIAAITPAGHSAAFAVSQHVTVPAGTTQRISFRPTRYPILIVRHPEIWWPYQLGAQPLYTLKVSVVHDGATLNSTSETFGIRTVTSYLTGRSEAERHGARAFKINGVPIVIRGGGWDPNLFLHYSAADTAKQIALMKSMGVNAIRLEGHIMPSDWFKQMDRAGILVNGGFQCCDAWAAQRTINRARLAILRNSAQTIGENLRNHPSVFSFQWSDNAPRLPQELVSLAGFSAADFHDPLISSAEYNRSHILGAAGEKEGPYGWAPPSYWYNTRQHDRFDRTQTNAGGAWGYDSEESAGDTVPTLASLRRFMSPVELAKLWQAPSYNQYHLNYEGTGHIGYAFGTMFNFDAALKARYGRWHSLSQYVEQAQLQNYEDTRAQFEAFIDHAHSKPVPSTGTIYWQMNKGWPSMLWTLYGFDGDQAGSYFGTQEADRPLHALYALDTGTVTLDNLGRQRIAGLSVQSRVYSLSGTLLDNQTASNISLTGQQVLTDVLKPNVPATTAPPAPARAYFVELLLRGKNGVVIDRNVYWLSTQPDVVSWRKSLDQPQGGVSQYANLTSLHSLRRSSISVTAVTTRRRGPAGADLATNVTITDTSTSTVAFFLRADVRRGNASGHVNSGDNELQSSIWQGNDITLFPGESQTITVTYDSADLDGSSPVISISGWNVPAMHIAAPVP